MGDASEPFFFVGEYQSARAPLVTRVAAGALAFLVVVSVALTPIAASAVELPPAGNAYWIQTNGPNGLVTLGDWYTSNVAGGGAGYHYVQFQVPCGWPAALPISVDLFSPEENRVAGALATYEEPNGNYDSTQFELYGPGATVGPGFGSPAPGAGIAGTRTTYQPGAAGVADSWVRFATLSAPVACGSYVVRSEVLTADPANPGGTGDDQNGWKLRVGNDNDANPNNANPANYDNPDGVAGTNDELMIGMAQVSFQQSSGAVACQTFYEYTTPGQASATFNNFDMDGNTRVRYYAPGDPAYDPNANANGTLGTLSGNGTWNNGGTLAGRVGDTIASPTTGWWRIVNCLSNGNQLIQEGQPGVLSYYTQPPTPNMTLTKTDAVATAAPGQALTYNITATNNSPAVGGGAANNVVVTDTIPAGFTYTGCSIPTPTQGTWTCSQVAGVVTFTQTGWINRGAAAVLRVTGTVNQGVTGSITDTARINYTDALGNAFPQVTATDVDTITASSNLSITKTDAPDPVNPGQAVVYTVTVNNAGPSDATNLVVSDTVPSQYTVTSVTSPAGSCGNVGNAVTCTRPTYASGAAAWVITINVTVNAATPGGTYVNTATVSATEADPTPANNTVNDSNTVRNTADLAVTKTDGVATVNVGASTTYTITLTNNGPTVVPAGVIVSDTIPVNTVGTEAEADCTIVAGVFRCTTATPLAVGASRSYQLTLTLSAGFATATLVNTASITTLPATFTDPVAANNTATDTDAVPQANLSITKTDSLDPVNPGQSFVYTLTVNNAGPSAATNVFVADTVPSQYTVTSVTSPTGACGNAGNAVTCNLASFPSGAAAWVITINVTVNASTPGGTYVNTATVSASSPNDPVPANNAVNNSNTVRNTADLALTKTDGVATVNVGASTTYTITVTNNGPTVEPAGIVISDNIPAGTTASEAEADCTLTALLFRCTTVTPLAVGASRSYQLTLTLPAAYAAATLVNTATITTFPITDPVAGNNAATDTDIVPQANLSITKTDSVDPVNPGQSFFYTLTVNNAGPSAATNLTVSDTVPSQYTVTSVTSPIGACGNAGNVVTCTLPSMASGAAAWVITVNVTVKTTTPAGTYVNTATVNASSPNDPAPANNAANNNNSVTAFADLVLTKTDGTATVTPGTSTTYTITITNSGPSTEPAGVRFTDTIPAGTVGSEAEADCAIAAGVFTCTTVATIAAGASRSYQLTLAVPSGFAPATLTNTATITVRPIVDPDLTNNSATDTDTVVRSANLSITKTDSADPVNPGQAFTYTLTVTNGGPSDASTLTVSDTVPAQFTVTNVTSPAGACGFAGQVITCTRPTLVNGATWGITVFVTTPGGAAGGTFTNTATVSAATADPVAANNSASQNTTITALADLAVNKTDGVASVVAGTSTDYTVMLTNNGPSAVAAGIVISDPVPAGTTGSETEPDCVIAANTFTCTTSAVLASGSSVVYHLILAVPAGYAPATLVNTASIASSPATDPTPANNTSTDTDSITRSADLSITKADSADPVVPGQAFTYTITVLNNGPSDASTLQVSDTVPAQFTVTNVTSPAGACSHAGNVVTCTRPALAASASWVITVSVTANLAPGTFTNTATVSAPTPDPVLGNNSGSQDTTIVPSADLSIVKTDSADPVNPPAPLDYTITVTNNGPSDALNLSVTDSIPAPGSFSITGTAAGPGSCVTSLNDVTCTLASLASGASWTITISVAVGPFTPGGVYTDTANVTSSTTFDPDLSNNGDSESTIVLPAADMVVTKDDGVSSVVAGTPTTYTITLTNNGPSIELAGVVVSDTIPAGTTGSTLDAACAVTPGAFTCTTTAPLAKFESVSYHLTIAVPPDYGSATLVNTATITTTPIAETDPSNNSDTDTDSVVVQGDIGLSKSDGVGSVTAGTSTTYTITATNGGPSQIPAGVVLSDPIPAGTLGSELEPNCSVAAGVFTCTTSAPLAVGASVSYQLTLAVAPGYALPTLTNTVSVSSSPAVDANPANDSATDTDTVTASADLAMSKTDGAASIVAGMSTTYTVTVTNNGPSTEPAGVVLSDPIPAGTVPSESEPACAIVGVVFTCTTPVPIAPGGSLSYQLTLAVLPNSAIVTVVNTVSITTFPVTDPVAGNNAASDTDVVTRAADLAITKSDGVASVVAGTSTTYTITVTNNGPSTEPAGVVVSDPIPAGTVPTSPEPACVVGVAFTCTTTVALAPGASVSYQLTLAIPPSYALVSLVNTASITSMPITDPNGANDSATDSDAVTTSADLSIVKTDSADPISPGQTLDYTITVTNNGPSDALGLTVTDSIPAPGFFVITGMVASAGGGCGRIGNDVTCNLAALIPGATWTVTISVLLNAATPGGLYTDSAHVTSTTADPAPVNNTDAESTIVLPAVDMVVTKTDGVATVAAGTSTTYTITLTNDGPSTELTGAVVSDAIPAGTIASEFEPNCVISGGVFTCTTTAPIAPGASVSYQLTLGIPSGYTSSTLVNMATISSSPIAEVDPTDDSATDTDSVTTTADLAITKTDLPDPVPAGGDVTYTLTVTNAGPADASSVVVTDTLPGSVTFGSATPSQGSCSVAAGVVNCSLGGLAVGATATIAIVVTTTTDGSIIDTAVVSATTSDPVLANNTASQTTTVTPVADLSITKTDGVTSVNPGSSTIFTITVTNNGPSDVPAGIVVTDQIPAGTVASENEVDCALTATTFTCTTTATLAAGASVAYHLTLAIDVAYTAATLLNTAAITSSPVPDPNPANDMSSDADTVTPLDADLSIVKTDSADPVLPGDSFSYTIVVTNAGPDDAKDIALTDSIPGVLTVSGVTSSGTGACLATANVLVCTIDTLAAGATWTVTVSVRVPLGTPSGTVTNTATVSGTGDTDLTNDSASQTTTIGESTGSADLTVTKTVDDASPQEGDTLTYVVTVANGGPDDATRVEVTDALPAGLTFVSAITTQGSYEASSGVWSVGSLAVGETAGLQIRAEVDDGTAGTTITNRALVSAVDQGDLAPSDDAATAPVAVVEAAGGPNDGGTAFTGFPGAGVIAWMFGLAMLGLFALALGSRRRLVEAPPSEGRRRSPTGRFLDTPEPFFFKNEE